MSAIDGEAGLQEIPLEGVAKRLTLDVLALAIRLRPVKGVLQVKESVTIPKPAVAAKVIVIGLLAHVVFGAGAKATEA